MLFSSLHGLHIDNPLHREMATAGKVPFLDRENYNDIVRLIGMKDTFSSLIPALFEDLFHDISRLFAFPYKHFEEYAPSEQKFEVKRPLCMDDHKLVHTHAGFVPGIGKYIHACNKRPGAVINASVCAGTPLGLIDSTTTSKVVTNDPNKKSNVQAMP